MNKKLDNKLCRKYPVLFRDRHADMKTTCMCWGFDVDDGWYKLIDDLCQKLQKIADVSGLQPIAMQVKEKFAGLRFYITFDPKALSNTRSNKKNTLLWSEIIHDIISNAENKSYSICEVCGEYGTNHIRGTWYKTLCDKCAKKLEYKDIIKK